MPSGMVIPLTIRFFGSSMQRPRVSPLICLRSLYVPGWMFLLRAFVLGGLDERLGALHHVRVEQRVAMSASAAPCLISTVTSPVPAPS